MWVLFKARAVFTDKITPAFWRLSREDISPFKELVAVGGTTNGYFEGVAFIEDATTDEKVAHAVTGLLVERVERLSKVGIDSIEFDVLDYQDGKTSQ